MHKLSEKNFAFLEQSPYFYMKRDPFIAKTGGMQTDIVYTFYSHESPYQEIAEIVIPMDMKKEIRWRFSHFIENEKQCIPIYQATNPKMDKMPTWFRALLKQAADIYWKTTKLIRMFNPELKNNSIA